MTDPYAALGLTPKASAEEIKAAYRRLIKQSHPDLNPDDPGAEARFKAISAAHDLLKDPVTRARFDAGEIDATGAERPQRRSHRGFGGGFGGAGPGAGGDAADLFAEMLRQRGAGQGGFGQGGFGQGGYGQGGSGPGGFGQGGSGPGVPGQDLTFTLEVGFLEAALGAKKKVTLPEVGHVEVQIPKGSAEGTTLRLRGKGLAGFGGAAPGDALISLTLRPHPVFRREGFDIHVIVPITLDEAVLGGKVLVPTIDGPVSVAVPAGASSGRVMRLRGRGVTRPKGAPGDQLVELRIVTPPQVDEALRGFMTDWRKSHPYDPRKTLLDEAEKD